MKEDKLNIIQTVWVNICRFLLAGLFIFSGFVKAVDPLGSMYKIQDYLEAFGLLSALPSFVPLLAAVVLSTLEFVLGVLLFFGVSKKPATLLTLLFMCFMTPLTLYLAIANPVSDCGCFGDAWVLSNWQTFWKNVVLLIAAISAYVWRRGIVRFVTKKSEWLISLYSVVFIVVISMYCLRYLPILDFRPYKIGNNIREEMSIPPDAKRSVYESVFILEKDGKREEFTLDNYPDSTWKFVDSRSILREKGFEPAITDFSLLSLETGEDITSEVLRDKNYTFLLVAHRIEEADDSNIDLINEIYDYSVERGYSFYCLTSSPDYLINQWNDRTGAQYPFCLVDDIVLKTIVRSNPGLVLIKDATIINKWSDSDLPDEYELTDSLENLPLGQQKNRNDIKTVGITFAWFVIPLLLVLGLDIFVIRRREKKKNINH